MKPSLQSLQSTAYKPPILPICPSHSSLHLPCTHICVSASCRSHLMLFCQSCPHPGSHLLPLSNICPRLLNLLQQKSQTARASATEIEKQWRTCRVNIQYCIDILVQVMKSIEDGKEKRLQALPIFDNIVEEMNKVYGSGSLEAIQGLVGLFGSKYGVFQCGGEGADIGLGCVDAEIEFRDKKWRVMGKKGKKFSERALAFAEDLAQSVESKLKYEKRKKQIEEITANKVANLKDLLKQYQNGPAQQLPEQLSLITQLKIQLPSAKASKKTSTWSQLDSSLKSNLHNNDTLAYLQSHLQDCHNLSSMHINNQNGRLPPKIWDILINRLQNLLKLHQLRLNIRLADLLLLTKLFKQKPNAVRQIGVLHLTLSDEPKLDMKHIACFCNTLQLRQVYLTLPRNNITKSNFKQFVQGFRFKTSLSCLPMRVLEINLSRNQIVGRGDAGEVQAVFEGRYGEIKMRKIVL